MHATPQNQRQKRPAPTKEQLVKVRQQFSEAGITYTAWASANGFDRQTVIDVVHGRRHGHRGEAHRVAVALGLKKGKVVSAKGFKPTASVEASQ